MSHFGQKDSNHSCDLGRVYEREYGVFPHSKFVSYYNMLPS
jgi:hypothetical protein